jgi:hypothetical protein
LRLLDCGLGSLNSGLSLHSRSRFGVKLALRNGPFLDQGGVAFHIDVGQIELRPCLGQLPFRLVERRLERSGVDFKQHITLVDVGAFLVVLADEIPAHLGLNLGVYVALQGRNPFGVDGHVHLDCLHHPHRCGRTCGGKLRLRTAATRAHQHHGRQRGQDQANAYPGGQPTEGLGSCRTRGRWQHTRTGFFWLAPRNKVYAH